MLTIICSIYDKACSAYMRPYVAQTPGAAIRQFEDEVNNPDSPMHKHPEDYAMFQIATFDDNKGSIDKIEPIVLSRAHEIQKTNERT